MPLTDRIATIAVDLPTVRGHVLSMTTMMHQSVVLVRMPFDDGSTGLGEGRSIGGMSYGAESPESIKAAVDTHIAPILAGGDGDRINATIGLMDRAVKGSPIARGAVETTLRGRGARSSGWTLRTSLTALSPAAGPRAVRRPRRRAGHILRGRHGTGRQDVRRGRPRRAR